MENARDDMHWEAQSNARGTEEGIHWGANWVVQCGGNAHQMHGECKSERTWRCTRVNTGNARGVTEHKSQSLRLLVVFNCKSLSK